MTRFACRPALTALLACVLAPPAHADDPSGRQLQHVVRAGSTPWQPCPATLPEGCEMAVLEGDPQGDGLFTVRFRVAGTFVMPPHWHPRDERVTVLSGTVAVAFGETAVRREATDFGPGDYYVNVRHAVHQVWIEGPAVIQITGLGPWKAVPTSVEPPPTSSDEDG